MRISRLYIPIALMPNQAVELDDDSAHYLHTVLRLKKGQPLVLFNGDGNEYSCSITEASRKAVSVFVKDCQARNSESPLQIALGLGISRGDRMDWAVQKSVELGVKHITPLLTERCVVQFKDEKKPQRLQHWQKIAQHACEQSGRTVMPAFAAVENLGSWVARQQGLKIFLDPYASTCLNTLNPEAMQVALLAGPEGGFADHERETAKAAGFIPVRLGPRILRTETAALSALTAVQTLWGDFR